MEDLEVGLSLIRSRPDLARFVGPREEGLVAVAEEALGCAFPPTYRRFVRELGAGSFGTFDLYGVIDDNFDDAAVPNGIWHTLTVRQYGLPTELILVSESADGIDYGLDTSQRDETNEAPVVEWTARGTPKTIVATDFGRFLLENVRMELDG